MNLRILISRNKREGGYCGRMPANGRSYWENLSGHYRAGTSLHIAPLTLRQWSRA
jgi:hypothetical protein